MSSPQGAQASPGSEKMLFIFNLPHASVSPWRALVHFWSWADSISQCKRSPWGQEKICPYESTYVPPVPARTSVTPLLKALCHHKVMPSVLGSFGVFRVVCFWFFFPFPTSSLPHLLPWHLLSPCRPRPGTAPALGHPGPLAGGTVIQRWF